MGAIGGAVSGGLGALAQGAGGAVGGAVKGFAQSHQYLYAAANGAAGSALTQGLAVATGLQDKFSWKQVAASAAGAAVGAAAGQAISKSGLGAGLNKAFGPTGGGIASNTLSGFASGVTQAAVMGGKIDYTQIAADAFGNALANSIAETMRPKPKPVAATTPTTKSASTQQDAPNNQSQVQAAPATQIQTAETETLAPGNQQSESLEGAKPLSGDEQRAQETRRVTAKGGDSISGILGTSDPVAIEAFMRANKLTSSKIYAGKDYVMPGEADYAASNGRLGQATLDADNARLAVAHSQGSGSSLTAEEIGSCLAPLPSHPNGWDGPTMSASPEEYRNGPRWEGPTMKDFETVRAGYDILDNIYKRGRNYGSGFGYSETITTKYSRGQFGPFSIERFSQATDVSVERSFIASYNGVGDSAEFKQIDIEAQRTGSSGLEYQRTTTTSASSTKAVMQEAGVVAKFGKYAGTAGDILEFGISSTKAYQQEGEFNSRVVATSLMDGFEILWSGGISTVSGFVAGAGAGAGAAATGIGAPWAPAVAWGVGTVTGVAVDNAG